MDMLTTMQLLGVIRVMPPPSSYWLNLCFPTTLQFDTEQIMFDQVTGRRRIAPFVAPNVQGRVIREDGFGTKTFKPAYTKPKHVIDPSRAIPRRAGEPLMGTLTPQARLDAIISENMRVEGEMIERLWEWMGARAVIDGAVTVAGEDYPSVTVDFARDSSLSITLLTTTKWSEPALTSTAAPLTDIESARTAVHSKSQSTINRLTMGLEAWGHFLEFEQVQYLLDSRFRGSDTMLNRVMGSGQPYEYRGNLSGPGGVGSLDVWTYADEYEDSEGVMQPFMDSGTVVGTGPGLQGHRCFGAIRDVLNMRPMEKFPKMWVEQDPSVAYTMTQSAPLMVPAQPNASFKLKVN